MLAPADRLQVSVILKALNLRWDQADFESGTITLAETKSNRRQVIAIERGPLGKC